MCPQTVNIWEQLDLWIQNKVGYKLNLNCQDKILGYLKFDSNYVPINIIILVTKSYIFLKARNSQSLLFQELQANIENTYDEQKLVSQMDFKNEKFATSWNLFSRLVNYMIS